MTPTGKRNRQNTAKIRSRTSDRSNRAEHDSEWRWFWGLHAAKAALANPRREIAAIMATRNALSELAEEWLALPGRPAVEIMDPDSMTGQLPAGAVHQGLAVRVRETPETDLYAIAGGKGVVLVLDQITDPQNVGAIFRSAAAFGARAVVMQDRKAPPFTGFVAKAAAGGLEIAPAVRVANIARSILALREAGYRAIGLAGAAEQPLSEALKPAGPVVLALGAEGRGLRPLVAESCDCLARIPMRPAMDSLNVAAAAAIALYEADRTQR